MKSEILNFKWICYIFEIKPFLFDARCSRYLNYCFRFIFLLFFRSFHVPPHCNFAQITALTFTSLNTGRIFRVRQIIIIQIVIERHFSENKMFHSTVSPFSFQFFSKITRAIENLWYCVYRNSFSFGFTN